MLRVIPNRHENFVYLITRRINEVLYETLCRILESNQTEILNGINIIKYKHTNDAFNIIYDYTYNDTTLEDKITTMLMNVSQHYSLKIYLNNFVKTRKLVSQGRHRRRRHHMMPFMVFGIVGLSMILIPMGFKFLTILGGKALLLAKMALMLSSIQGLKKLATSSYNYGLYQTPPVHPWHYDRHGYEDISNTQSEAFPSAYIHS
ncbi:hypothetical protein RN001_005103 [Aquatica leii]|uniref:Uncharacterized protein n=1 Tax=Aquatica leii TaxID=1421715 RepID=A0AAN7PC56_9COLE|nr:hypothetical protein RN001_005103 [Aquatica leii]